jgi:hypothetical protein
VKRKHVSLKTKLVAALCQMRREVDGRWELILTHAEAAALSEDQILSLFQWHHGVIPHAEDGPDTHWNLEPMLIVEHRVITKKVDVPGIAKRKQITKKHEEFRTRLLTPRHERPSKQSRWASRPFPKRGKHETRGRRPTD